MFCLGYRLSKNFFFRKKSIRDIRLFYRPLLCHSSDVKYTSSPLQWWTCNETWLPNITEIVSPSPTLLAGSDPWPWVSGETWYLGLLVVIFIPARPLAADKWSSAWCRPCGEDTNSTESSEKSQRLILQLPTVTPSSAVTVYPIRADHEEECWQPTTLSESNTNGERLWFNSPDTDTNLWAGIQWLHGQ